MPWMWSRICSMTRGVNALLTSARRRVWSGGSRNSMERGRAPFSVPSPYTADSSSANPSRPNRGSRSAVTQSSYRVSTQNPSGLWCTGSSSRSRR